VKTALILLLAGGVTLAPLLRDTNSRAATARGVAAFAKGDYPTSVAAFHTALQLAPTPARALNLGTAQIAAGNREEGSATLARALRDPALRGAALFNRGNAALAAKAYDYAIRDFSDALRVNPKDVAAKRNLEIALRKKAQQDQQQQNQSGNQPKPPPNQPQTPAPQAGSQTPKGNPDVDALLRSVQQQEQEELARMRGQKVTKGRIGW